MKNLFPIYKKYPDLAYLDSAATSLKPQTVIDAVTRYYSEYSANIHRGAYGISETATLEYERARETVAEFIGAKPEEVIFTSGTTDSINKVANSWGEANIGENDEIIVSVLEHHSNLVPWQMLAKKKEASLKYLKIVDGRSSIIDLRSLLSDKTKLVALTHVSNVLGTVNPIKEIVESVKKYNPDIKVLIDGAQAVAHMPIDVGSLGVDFYAFSGHKMYGPTGIGVLWVKESIAREMQPFNFGGGMIREVFMFESTFDSNPTKFEAGTPPIAQAIGLGEAVNFIKGLGFKKIIEQKKALAEYAVNRLKEIGGIRLVSKGDTGIVSFTIDGIHAHDIATILDNNQVCVRSGHHCAMPLHSHLGIMATTRASIGIYNDESDIDKLIEGIMNALKIFKLENKIKINENSSK